MEKLCLTDGPRMKALREGAKMIRDTAFNLLKSDGEPGRKLAQRNPGAIRLRMNKNESYIQVSGTQRDDKLMPWFANGTDARDTDKGKHRGRMWKAKKTTPPPHKGKYIETAVKEVGTAAIEETKKWFEDYIQNWKNNNPGNKI